MVQGPGFAALNRVRVLGYNGNGVHFRRKTAEVATQGYQEFRFS
jgi:hypothetical protein